MAVRISLLIIVALLSTSVGEAQSNFRRLRMAIAPAAAGGGGGGTELASDNFTRANETPLASPWLVASASGANTEFNLVSGFRCEPELLSHDCQMFYSGVAWTTNQYSQCAVNVVGTTLGSGFGVLVRANTVSPNETFYRVVVSHNATMIDVAKIVAGSYSSLATRTGTWVDNDVLRVECTGTSTTTIKVFQNGVQLGADITDASSPLQAGSPGICYSSTASAGFVDAWSAGSIP